MKNCKAIWATGGSGLGAALGILIVWGITSTGVEVPETVNGAIAVIVTAIVAGVTTWLAPANEA